MTKTTIITALTLAVLMADASAQSRTYNDASKSVGRSTTDSGTTTNHDAGGRNIERYARGKTDLYKGMLCSVYRCWYAGDFR